MEGAIESAVLTCRENTEALNHLACMGANILGFLGLNDKGAKRRSPSLVDHRQNWLKSQDERSHWNVGFQFVRRQFGAYKGMRSALACSVIKLQVDPAPLRLRGGIEVLNEILLFWDGQTTIVLRVLSREAAAMP